MLAKDGRAEDYENRLKTWSFPEGAFMSMRAAQIPSVTRSISMNEHETTRASVSGI